MKNYYFRLIFMKLEVKRLLQTYFDVKDEKLLNKVLWSIKWRQDCYWEVWLSRCETEKFNTTQRQLRDVIENFRKNDFLILKERRKWDNNKWLCNVYEIWSKLKQILSLLQTYIEFLNEKIIKWSKEHFEWKLQEYWIKYFHRNWRLFERKSKITYSKRNFVITNWKINKHYNLFEFLKEYYWLNTIQLIKEINLW